MNINKLRKRLRKARGFTLVELMIVVAIVGILAALAIYGVKKYVTNAKTTEARNGIGQIAKDAVSAYSKDKMAESVMVGGNTTEVTQQLCGSSAPVPATADKIKGAKYQSLPTEWIDDPTAKTGWSCLKFSMNDPQYYQYVYTSGSATEFLVEAHGDLDGDDDLSTFSIGGGVEDGSAKHAPTIKEDKPDE